MDAQELLDTLASLPNGAAFSAINSNGQYNVTFAVISQQSPRRVSISRVSNVDLAEALATGVVAARANLPE